MSHFPELSQNTKLDKEEISLQAIKYYSASKSGIQCPILEISFLTKSYLMA